MTTHKGPWHDEPDDLSELLNDLPTVDPPSTLVDSVMSAVGRRSTDATTQPTSTFMKKGSTMAKKVLWSVAAAAAAALVVMRVGGYPPVEKGTEATIGAAQRYQAQQIATADVKVDDAELQAFLQSDLFRQLASDKAAQQALKDPDLQRALSDAAVRAALARADVRNQIATNAKQLASADARNNVSSGARLDAAASAALDAALSASPALAKSLARADVAAAIANSSLATILARPDAVPALSTSASINAVLSAAAAASLGATSN